MKMKIKRKNINEIIEIIILIIMLLVCFYVFYITKKHILKVSFFLVSGYLLILIINGIRILMNCNIILDDKYLKVGYLDKIGHGDYVKKLFTPFIKNFSHYTLFNYEIELSSIKRFDFVKNIKGFNNKRKFDIGLIDEDNNKYIIIINQFNDEDILSLMNVLHK